MENFTYDQAVQFFGSPASMARALGIKPQAVYNWDGVIPPLRRYQIADLMNADQPDVADQSAA